MSITHAFKDVMNVLHMEECNSINRQNVLALKYCMTNFDGNEQVEDNEEYMEFVNILEYNEERCGSSMNGHTYVESPDGIEYCEHCLRLKTMCRDFDVKPHGNRYMPHEHMHMVEISTDDFDLKISSVLWDKFVRLSESLNINCIDHECTVGVTSVSYNYRGIKHIRTHEEEYEEGGTTKNLVLEIRLTERRNIVVNCRIPSEEHGTMYVTDNNCTLLITKSISKVVNMLVLKLIVAA